MCMRSLAGKLLFMVAIATSANVAVVRQAAACKCVPPTVEASYNNSTDVVEADIRLQFVLGSTRVFVARVLRTYKGCLAVGELAVLTTPVASATCGAQLASRRHLINGTAGGALFGLPVLTINSCNYNVALSALTEHDRAFLNGRNVCCGDDCSCADGSNPVLCFADPCSVAPKCSEGQCVANYCGGCHAEFYDEGGRAVCQGESACARDADCPSGEWCRQTASSSASSTPAYECVPFVGAGSRCNGFTTPSNYERCQPNLVCDTPDFIADAPGICRPKCTSERDCAAEGYCASDGLCEDDGACEREVDCSLPGNGYAHIECVGHGTCDTFETRRCGWACENPQCIDLSGLDLGPCDAVLGWAVSDGACAAISGCSSPMFKLFESEAACLAACPSK